MNPREAELIRNIQSGATEQFGELYDAYVRKIYNFIYYKTHHKETAEDLTSQVFFKALRTIAHVDPEKKFSSWLYKIAQNTVIDHYRASRPELNIDDVWDLAGTDDIPRDIDAKLKLDAVEAYLKTLPREKRDIIVLRVWEGLSYKEIADILGKTEDSAKMMFSRTVAELRKSIPLSLFLLFISHQ